MWWGYGPDEVMAVAATVAAAATVVYVVVAACQLRAIHSETTIAAKTLVLAQRPRLIVRNVVVRPPHAVHGAPDHSPFPPGLPIGGQFYVANIGGTPAHVRDAGCWVLWTQDASLPMERPYEGKDGNLPLMPTIAPGASVPFPFASEQAIETVEIGNWLWTGQSLTQQGGQEEARWRLYVMGWIEYADDLGSLRRTAFCRVYKGALSHEDGRYFVAVDRIDYEHAE